MRARLVIVPLDLRMAPDAIERSRRAKAEAAPPGHRHRPRRARSARGRPGRVPDIDRGCTRRGARRRLPGRLGARRSTTWARPKPDEIVEMIFTAGTTGKPKGVMLASRQRRRVGGGVRIAIMPPMDHRVVSLLPLSHLLEQSTACTTRCRVGADILYVRSRNPRVIFEAIREHRVTTMVVVPQVLDLFWSAIEREVDKRGRRAASRRLRPIAGDLPMRRPADAVPAHPRAARRQLPAVPVGRGVPAAGAPAGMGGPRRRRDAGLRRDRDGHRLPRRRSRTTASGRWAGRPRASRCRLAEDGEILFRGPTLFQGYWSDPEATAEAFTADGWYRTGDIGHFDDHGRLHPDGPQEGHHRAAERLQRVSRGHRERAPHRRACGIRWSSRRRPGGSRPSCSPPVSALPLPRGDGAATALDPACSAPDQRGGQGGECDPRAPNQRIAAWRLWPERRLPADAYAQGEARPGPRLGGRRRAAARPRGESPVGRRGSPSGARDPSEGCRGRHRSWSARRDRAPIGAGRDSPASHDVRRRASCRPGGARAWCPRELHLARARAEIGGHLLAGRRRGRAASGNSYTTM